MKATTSRSTERPANPVARKQPYRPPSLAVLGKLHGLTQGTGGMKGDGAQGMARA